MFVQVPFSVDVPTSSSLLGQFDVCGQPLVNECLCALGHLMLFSAASLRAHCGLAILWFGQPLGVLRHPRFC